MAEKLCEMASVHTGENLIYSASTYSETVNLSESYKNYKNVLIIWSIASVLKSDYFLTSALNIGDYVGNSFSSASHNYFIYGSITSNTQISISARDSGESAYIKAIYGIN